MFQLFSEISDADVGTMADVTNEEVVKERAVELWPTSPRLVAAEMYETEPAAVPGPTLVADAPDELAVAEASYYEAAPAAAPAPAPAPALLAEGPDNFFEFSGEGIAKKTKKMKKASRKVLRPVEDVEATERSPIAEHALRAVYEY